ncbi:NAD(P)-binding protein [Ophiobolus disseminans]|uniref:NAD(P)-binding protein n=1 Tax=Ophiobolus disseminans TaxID=1469910 RepID=A0A6A7AFW2_9PLEO|nr:NAD(P)-binding protein [Ophiobolus disseminans]
MSAQQYDPDMFTKMMCLTSTYRLSPYPAIQSAQSSTAGKHILITGASQGLGAQMAKSWVAGGAAGVAICARTASKLDSVAAELKAINPDVDVLAHACDTTKPEDVEKFFLAAKEKFGKLDVVVANVGIATMTSPEDSKIGVLDPEVWWDQVTSNIRSTHLTAHYFVKTFGPDPTGTFIAMTSGAAAIIPPGLSGYGMTKQACIRITEFLDVEYPKLRCFSMDPGIVKGLATMDAYKPFAVVEPELVGQFSVWLASGRAEGCRGGYLHVAWDVEELEAKADEIKEKGLIKSKFLSGVLGQEGGALAKKD